MKIVTIIIMLLASVNNITLKSFEFKSVCVENEGIYTTTPYRVDCNSFRQTFKKTMETTLINNERDLVKLYYLQTRFKDAQRKLDVRGIITFNYKKIKVSYCFDKFGYIQRDDKVFYNKELYDFLDSKIHF